VQKNYVHFKDILKLMPVGPVKRWLEIAEQKAGFLEGTMLNS
jgi:hypothetical protein